MLNFRCVNEFSAVTLLSLFRHVANGEILGVSLLMEDVLQTGYQDISHLSDADDLETARSEKKDGSLAPSRGASRLDIQTPTGSISSKAGLNIYVDCVDLAGKFACSSK